MFRKAPLEEAAGLIRLILSRGETKIKSGEKKSTQKLCGYRKRAVEDRGVPEPPILGSSQHRKRAAKFLPADKASRVTRQSPITLDVLCAKNGRSLESQGFLKTSNGNVSQQGQGLAFCPVIGCVVLAVLWAEKFGHRLWDMERRVGFAIVFIAAATREMPEKPAWAFPACFPIPPASPEFDCP